MIHLLYCVNIAILFIVDINIDCQSMSNLPVSKFLQRLDGLSHQIYENQPALVIMDHIELIFPEEMEVIINI